MDKAEERSKERVQAALDYANNLDGIKPTDEFRINLCIALGQAFIKGAEWADEHQAEKDLTDKAKLSSGWDGFYYGQGYKQAEKDLELSWKDIELIVNIDKDTDNEESIIGIRNNEEHYQEVLERFKNLKKGKNWKSKNNS